MAQFVAFEKEVEVNGRAILSVIKVLPVGQEERSKVLSNHGIQKPEAGKWYPQQAWLNAFKELAESMGNDLLFSIGQAIPEYVAFPQENNTLESALKSIDQAYRLNHRGGEIGSYRLVEFKEKEKKAVMICQTPYPSELDRGMISTLVEQFRPASSAAFSVALDNNKTSRTKGNHSCTYAISW